MRQVFVKFVRCCWLIGTATLVSHTLSAQAPPNSEGSLSGTVRDPSGAAIVGAHVALKDDAGKAREAQTDRAGAYHFSALLVGHYSLSAESRGFQAQSKEVNADGQKSLTMNFVLAIEAKPQSITVSDRLDRHGAAVCLHGRRRAASPHHVHRFLEQQHGRPRASGARPPHLVARTARVLQLALQFVELAELVQMQAHEALERQLAPLRDFVGAPRTRNQVVVHGVGAAHVPFQAQRHDAMAPLTEPQARGRGWGSRRRQRQRRC